MYFCIRILGIKFLYSISYKIRKKNYLNGVFDATFRSTNASTKQNQCAMTDEQLVYGCVQKDRYAQQNFYQKFSGKMMGVCLRYADSRDEAQDILQESFIKIFDKIQTFSGKGSLEGWVRRIVVNQALDNYRRNKAHKKNLDISDYEYQIETDEKIMDSFAANDLLKVIQKLPLGFKTVFNLYAIEGFSHKEIAQKLGISESTSKSQYSRARSHLQNMLKSENILVK